MIFIEKNTGNIREKKWLDLTDGTGRILLI